MLSFLDDRGEAAVGKSEHERQTDLLQGTLDMLILKAVSLYPALYRLEHQGAIASSWGESENNRRAKYYRLTRAGRARLEEETQRWNRMSGVINSILRVKAEEA